MTLDAGRVSAVRTKACMRTHLAPCHLVLDTSENAEEILVELCGLVRSVERCTRV